VRLHLLVLELALVIILSSVLRTRRRRVLCGCYRLLLACEVGALARERRMLGLERLIGREL
jgi:hypothetical protein